MTPGIVDFLPSRISIPLPPRIHLLVQQSFTLGLESSPISDVEESLPFLPLLSPY